MKKAEKAVKVVRVGFDEEAHTVFEEYQRTHKLAKGSTPGKADIVVLAMQHGGIAWLKDQIKAFKKEVKSSI